MRKIILLTMILLLIITPLVFSATIIQTMSELRNNLQGIVGIAAMTLIVLSAIIYALSGFLNAEMRARSIVWATNLLIGVVVGFVVFSVFSVVLDAFQPGNRSWLTIGSGPADALPLFFFRGTGVLSEQARFIFIGISIGVLIAVLFYFLGSFFNHPPMLALAKEQVAALFVTLIIIFLWNFFDSIFNQVATGLVCLPASNLCQVLTSIGTADATHTARYIPGFARLAEGGLEMLATQLKSDYGQLYLFEVLIGFLSTISLPLGSHIPVLNFVSFSFTPFAGLSLLSNAHTIVVEAIGYMLAVIISKQFILNFSIVAMPLIILPLGLALRAFPMFRTTGSSLIAIAIVAYFVYPFSLLLTNYLIFDVYFQGLSPNDEFNFVPKKISAISALPTEPDVLASQQQSKEYLDHLQKSLIGSDVTNQPNDNFFASIGDLFKKIGRGVLGFYTTAWHIFEFMIGYSGNIIEAVFYNVLPFSAIGGLYNFIVAEVLIVGRFIALITFTSVLELIITITMYRNIAALIGGEVELIGLAKLV